MSIVDAFLNVVLTTEALIGFLFNLYVVISILLTKQVTKSGNVFLLHMGLIFTVQSILFLLFNAPGLFVNRPVGGSFICDLLGFVSLMLHPLGLWTVAGINLDRFISIVFPLRYTGMMSFRKATAFIGFSWLTILTITLPVAFSAPPMFFNVSSGGCWPNFSHYPVFPSIYLIIGTAIPIFVIITSNLKVVSIARYHRYRIANALFNMAPLQPVVSQSHIAENARVRNWQADALQNFEGVKAVATLAKYVGSLCLFYIPVAILHLYETLSGNSEDSRFQESLLSTLSKLCFISLMTSPIFNCVLYGFKNKTLQTKVIHLVRKEFAKSEVQEEIRLRSPNQGHQGPPNSSRPSVCSLVGQLTFQVPYLNRHMSEISLDPSGRLPHRELSIQSVERHPVGTLGRNRRLAGRAGRIPGKHPMIRHVSDLTWRVSALPLGLASFGGSSTSMAGAGAHSLTIKERRFVKKSLEVPSRTVTSFPEIPTDKAGVKEMSSSRSFSSPRWKTRKVKRINRCLASSTSDTGSDFRHPAEVNWTEIETHRDQRESRLGVQRSRTLAISSSSDGFNNFKVVVRNMFTMGGTSSTHEEDMDSSYSCDWQQKHNTPKITITKVDSMDESGLEYLGQYHQALPPAPIMDGTGGKEELGGGRWADPGSSSDGVSVQSPPLTINYPKSMDTASLNSAESDLIWIREVDIHEVVTLEEAAGRASPPPNPSCPSTSGPTGSGSDQDVGRRTRMANTGTELVNHHQGPTLRHIPKQFTTSMEGMDVRRNRTISNNSRLVHKVRRGSQERRKSRSRTSKENAFLGQISTGEVVI